MRTVVKSQAEHRPVAAVQHGQRVSGPQPIAAELLQLIGGGKGSPTEPAKPTAPVNKW